MCPRSYLFCMKERKRILTVIISIAIAITALVAVIASYYFRPRVHVCVMFSFEETQYAYKEFREAFEAQLRRLDINAEVSYFYLDCEKYAHDPEVAHARMLMDLAQRKGPIDYLVTVGDQATYSTSRITLPVIHDVPWIFAGVLYPAEDILDKFPNLSGFTNTPDVVTNIRLAKKLTGDNATFTLLDRTFLDKCTRRNIDRQLAGVKNIVNNLDWQYPLLDIGRFAQTTPSITPFSLRDISTNTVVSEDKEYQGTMNLLHATRRYSNMTYIQFKYDSAARAIINFNMNKPMLTAVWHDFGSPDSNFLGGYFVSGTTMAHDVAGRIDMLSRGVTPKKSRVTASKSEYFIDWRVAQKYGYTVHDLPKGFKVVNLSWTYVYPGLAIGLVVGGIVLVVGIFIYMIYTIQKERRQKKQAMVKMQQQQTMYQMAVLNTNVFAWERNGDLITLVDTFWQYHHVTPHVININDFMRFIHPEDLYVYKDGLQHTGRGESFANELRADFEGKGEYHWWQIRGQGFLNGKGEYTQSYGMLMNVDEFKQREQELEEARQKAEAADLKEAFLANMSHEIRTPLNAIVGFSQLLASDMEFSEEERTTFINTINHNNELLLKLIGDILDISRIESGHMEFVEQTISMNKLMGDIYQSFSIQIPKHLQFKYHHPDIDLKINIDKGRIQQVLTNFLTNAAKFTSEGSITLGWNFDEQKSEVSMYVEDTGVGLSEEDCKQVFNRFYKVDEFQQGTGLGLSICQVIVNRMKGRILVDSKLGKGSRFSVVLRIAQGGVVPSVYNVSCSAIRK